MKRIQPLKLLMVTVAIATPLCLMVSVPVFAAKPVSICIVGKSHDTIKLAVNDPACEFINVPAGTFYENLVINRNVTIRGAGPESTILDGSQRGGVGGGTVIRIGTIGPLYPNHVVVLKGMTITGGKPIAGLNFGGGIDSMYSTLTIKDSVISGNEARRVPVDPLVKRPGQGGGIGNFMGMLIVKDSVIRDNKADRCAGIRTQRFLNQSGSPKGTAITDSEIVDNDADGVLDTNFGDMGEGQGGGLCIGNDTLTLKDSIVSGNTALRAGGGIYINLPSTLVMTDSAITDNDVLGDGGAGGGIYNLGTLVVKDSSTTGNTPDNIAP